MGKGKSLSNERHAIATNDSSIVSKRSAERVGYFNEKQFLEYFVTKPQRRAPLIHLGYYVRCWAIDYVITKALETTPKKHVIINLGCGYDPTFFRLAHRKRQHINAENHDNKMIYIDIDYPALIQKKKEFIDENMDTLFEQEQTHNKNTRKVKLDANGWYSDGQNFYRLVPRDLSDAQGLANDICDLGLDGLPILFVSEVSTVYMPAEKATDLFRVLSSTFMNSSLCILEQTLPQHRKSGESSAFRHVMLDHFERNAKTPIHGAIEYPTIAEKCDRLLSLSPSSCWDSTQYSTLRDLWKHESFAKTREESLSREPFDEWEELYVFLDHYCVILATSSKGPLSTFKSFLTTYIRTHQHDSFPAFRPLSLGGGSGDDVYAEDGKSFQVSRRGHTATTIGSKRIFLFGGFGYPCATPLSTSSSSSKNIKDTRLSHGEILSLVNSADDSLKLMKTTKVSSTNEPSPRSFHSAVAVRRPSTVKNSKDDEDEERIVVIFGGRRGPREVFDDLYVYNVNKDEWTKIEKGPNTSLYPKGVFRHDATYLDGSDAILIYGGITSDGHATNDAWLLDIKSWTWARGNGFSSLPQCHSHRLVAYQQSHYRSSVQERKRPITGPITTTYDLYCIGGMYNNGQFAQSWRTSLQLIVEINNNEHNNPTYWSELTLINEPPSPIFSDRLERFGCTICPLQFGGQDWIVVVGGARNQEKDKFDVVVLKFDHLDNKKLASMKCIPWMKENRLWIQHSACILDDNTGLVILGGGGTCFSFGTRMDEQVVVLECMHSSGDAVKKKKVRSTTTAITTKQQQIVNNYKEPNNTKRFPNIPPRSSTSKKLLLPAFGNLQRIVVRDRTTWEDVLERNEPVILTGMNLGECTELWKSKDYLIDRCGNQKVSIHVKRGEGILSSTGENGEEGQEHDTQDLRWHDRNFHYEMMPMDTFIDKVFSREEQQTTTLYLRSLSATKSGRKPARLDEDFPGLASDFVVPSAMEKELVLDMFSSVLRISSGNTGIWAHYDVYDNVLMQISGRKRIRVWDPRDADKMYLDGSSSRIPNGGFTIEEGYPLLNETRALEGELEEGEGIYIPACWIHSVQSGLDGDVSIGVNVFFGDGNNSQRRKRGDVWGNVDGEQEKDTREDVLRVVRERLATLPRGRRAMYTHKVAAAIAELARGTDEDWL